MKVKAFGTGYILVPRESKYGEVSLSGRHNIIIPREGEVYDFTDHAYAWVCGTPYNTTANGWSEPFNAAGKKIRIAEIKPGNPRKFSVINFELKER